MRVVAILISSSLLFACSDEPDFEEASSAVVVDNKLAGNTLAQNKLAGNTLAGNKLAGNQLSNNRLALNQSADDLLATEDGREVLSFIVSCALEEGTILTGEFGGDTFEFFGDVGLAKKWLKKPLDSRGKGWVSACLFARVNASAVAVPISLRGPSPALTADDAEKETWTLQEGAFFGNFFTDENEPIDWNACRGADQAAGETAGLISRDCAEPDGNTGLTLCGFKYAGDCGNFAEDYACKKFDEDGTFYRKCRAAPDFHQKKGGDHDDDDDNDDDDNDGRAYRQVITTYVLGA